MTVDTAKLRELIAKATPGPWEAHHYLVFFPHNAGGFSISDCPDRDANAAVIVGAVNALPALLDMLDDYRDAGASAVRWAPSSAHWSNELRRLFGDDAREGIDVAERHLRDAQAEIERKDAEVARLREALQLLLHEVDESAIAGAQDYGWPSAVAKSRAALSHSHDDPTGVSAPQEA